MNRCLSSLNVEGLFGAPKAGGTGRPSTGMPNSLPPSGPRFLHFKFKVRDSMECLVPRAELSPLGLTANTELFQAGVEAGTGEARNPASFFHIALGMQHQISEVLTFCGLKKVLKA